MTQYDDIFMRDALDDTGQIPSGVRTAYHSPDIIPWGNQTVSDPQTFFVDNYDQNPGKNLVANEINYIYTRGKNLASAAANGQIYLYWVKSSLLSQPSEWRNNKVPTATPGQNYSNVSASQANQIVVGESAFQWSVPAPPTGYHYCLVSQVVTAANPNPIPDDFNSTGGFVGWVVDNPGIAWRNVSVLSNASPPSYQVTTAFQNLDDTEELYAFTVEARNLPQGTTVSLVCSETGPNPPINSSGTVTQQNPWYLYTENSLPAHFSSGLVTTVRLPSGQSWPPDATIDITYNRIVGSRDQEILLRHAKTPAEMGLPEELHDKVSGTMVRLGTYNIVVDS
ncbi:MAG: hypothetical protein RIB97_07095 [Nitratireductor sp.]